MALARATLCAAVVCVTLTSAAVAAPPALQREPEAGDLRLGQRVRVDDGSCPAGQIKEITGARLTAEGVVRTRQCVKR